jgi:hypothetical protein
MKDDEPFQHEAAPVRSLLSFQDRRVEGRGTLGKGKEGPESSRLNRVQQDSFSNCSPNLIKIEVG